MGYADHSRLFNCGVQVSEVTLVPTEAAKLDVTRIVTIRPGQDPDPVACLASTARARPLSAPRHGHQCRLWEPGKPSDLWRVVGYGQRRDTSAAEPHDRRGGGEGRDRASRARLGP